MTAFGYAISAGGPKSAEMAGRLGDGFVGTSAQREIIESYQGAGGTGPRYGQLTVCWGPDEAAARRTAFEIWPTAGVRGELSQELPTPAHFEQAAQMVTEEQIGEAVVCGPDPKRHVEAIQGYVDAGYDHVYIHQVGPDQEGFIEFAKREILPAFASATGR